MNVRQRDLVLLPVPFSNQSSQKVRPAVVVSNDMLNTQSDDVILVPLTSVIKDAPYSVMISQNDLTNGRLVVESRARTDKIFTAEKSLITMKIGAVNQGILTAIKQGIIKSIE